MKKNKKYVFTLEYQVEIEAKNEKIAYGIMEQHKPFLQGYGCSTKDGNFSYKSNDYFKIKACEKGIM